MDLKSRINALYEYIHKYGLPGFTARSEDTYTEDYRVVKDEMHYLADQMKKAVKRGNKEHFDLCEKEYIKFFKTINTLIAKTHFADVIDEYLKQDYGLGQAEQAALNQLWKDFRYREWLPAQARMSHQDGTQVFLIASEKHAPKEGYYVTIDEINKIKQDGVDPWQYVRERNVS